MPSSGADLAEQEHREQEFNRQQKRTFPPREFAESVSSALLPAKMALHTTTAAKAVS